MSANHLSACLYPAARSSSCGLFTTSPHKRYLFGGGYIGYLANSKKRVTTMQGKADGYWSQDGINWVKINYGKSFAQYGCFCARS